MNLYKENNVVLVQKAIKARQLEYYTKQFASHNSLLKKGLSTIGRLPDNCKAVLAFIESEQPILENGSTFSEFFLSKENLDSFMNDGYIAPPDGDVISIDKIYRKNLVSYAQNLRKLKDFSDASELLESALPSPESELNEEYMDAFVEYMENTSPETVRDLEFFSKHTDYMIGHQFYANSKESEKRLYTINESLVPKSAERNSVRQWCRPFTRATTLIKIRDGRIAQGIFTQRDAQKYNKKELKPGDYIKEAAYMAGNVAIDKTGNVVNATGTFLKDHGRQIAAVATIGLMLYGGASGVKFVGDKIAQIPQKATTNVENGYEPAFSENLTQKVIQLNQDIDSLDNTLGHVITDDEYAQIVSFLEQEDELLTDYSAEIGEQYFAQKIDKEGEDIQFLSASDWFDDRDRTPSSGITIHYTVNGEEKTKVIYGFVVNEIIEDEKALDKYTNLTEREAFELAKSKAENLDKYIGTAVSFGKVLGVQRVATGKAKEKSIESDSITSQYASTESPNSQTIDDDLEK